MDEWILAIRNWSNRVSTKAEVIKLATVAVKMFVVREAVGTVDLMACNLRDSAMAVCEQIKDSLQPSSIQVDILSNVLYDAQTMSKLENARGVTAQSTLYCKICQELELLKR